MFNSMEGKTKAGRVYLKLNSENMDTECFGEYGTYIFHLRSKIHDQEEKINQAAIFGQQLLREKERLLATIDNCSTRNETLVQTNYTLQANLDAKTGILDSYSSEIEILREKSDHLEKLKEIFTKENSYLQKRYEGLLKENGDLKIGHENLQKKTSSYQSKISELNEQLKSFQNQTQRSFCESNDEELLSLQSEITLVKNRNSELEELLVEMQLKIDNANMTEKRLMSKIQELEEEVSDRDKEIASYSSEVKKAQDELLELQGENEALKFDKIDVNKRGNSVFAELDDRRLHIETSYATLKDRFKNISEKYEVNKKELLRARNQLATLLCMSTRESDAAYIEDLENNLSEAKKEVSQLTKKLADRSSSQKDYEQYSSLIARQGTIQNNDYDFLRVMLEQAQESNKALEQEMMSLRMENLFCSEKLISTQRLLHSANRDFANSRGEFLKMKLQLKESVEQNQDDSRTAKLKSDVEYLPGYKPTEGGTGISSQNSSVAEDTNPTPDSTILIPAETEFSDNFVKARPSRKSNKWVLHKHNPTMDSAGKEIKSPKKDAHKEVVKTAVSKGNSVEAKENKTNHLVRTQKIVQRDNCTQQ